MTTLFLKSEDIPTLTAFSGNIDADSLKPHIYTAQTNDIKRILSKPLYDKMLTDYEAGTGTGDLTGVYLDIYNDYLVPMEVYFACMYYMTFGGVKISNNGTVKISFTNGVTLSESEKNNLIATFRQLANNNEQFFYDYMSENEIPEYTNTKEDESNNNPIIQLY